MFYLVLFHNTIRFQSLKTTFEHWKWMVWDPMYKYIIDNYQ